LHNDAHALHCLLSHSLLLLCGRVDVASVTVVLGENTRPGKEEFLAKHIDKRNNKYMHIPIPQRKYLTA
jgi:hypothetical protein